MQEAPLGDRNRPPGHRSACLGPGQAVGGRGNPPHSSTRRADHQEQEQVLRERAKEEDGSRFLAGIDPKTLKPYLKSADDQQRDQRKRLGPGGSDLADVVATGFYVTGRYLLTGENAVYNGPVIPKRPLNPLFGRLGPGAWELALRYSQLNFGSDDPVNFFSGNLGSRSAIPGGQPTAENGVQSLTVGVNWYLNSRVRAMFNFSEYWYETQLGTPFSCTQASCSAGTLQGMGISNYEIQTRLQFWF